MELSSNVILDMALNIAGYLAAGALSVIVYSAFNNRRTETRPAPAMAATAPSVTPPPARKKNADFVSFDAPASAATTARRKSDSPAPRVDRSDRTDIHRIAREMIKAGATVDKIQRVLPISEAELQLLTLKAN